MSAGATRAASGGEPRQVVVFGRASGFAQKIEVGPHRIQADEPAAVGGTETGPNPYDLLLAALGSCTSMTIALYARRKQWPLESVELRLRHTKVHAADCADCDKQVRMIDRIECEVKLNGSLSSEQRRRLLEIAGKCPVHRTLTSKPDIRAQLVSDTEQ